MKFSDLRGEVGACALDAERVAIHSQRVDAQKLFVRLMHLVRALDRGSELQELLESLKGM